MCKPERSEIMFVFCGKYITFKMDLYLLSLITRTNLIIHIDLIQIVRYNNFCCAVRNWLDE